MSKIVAAAPAATKSNSDPTTSSNQAAIMGNKKRVRFCEPNQNKVHLPTDAILQCDKLFYSHRDFFQMKQDIFLAVRWHKQNMELPPHFSWRGLEYAKSGILAAKQDERRQFVRDFLSLQRELRRSQVLQQEDPLSLFVTAKSKACRKDALKKAKQDEHEARKVYKQAKISSASWTGHNNTTTDKRHNFRMFSFVQGLLVVPSNREFRESSTARTA